MMREQPVPTATFPGLDSPPGVTTSKSSMSSSFQSINSQDTSFLTDVGHFEDIGLDDDTVTLKSPCRISARSSSSVASTAPRSRNLAAGKRSSTPCRSFPNLQSSLHASNPRSTNPAVLTDPRTLSLAKPSLTSPSRRNRSTSPILSLKSRDQTLAPRPRRGSWQSSRDRKTLEQLEHECDEDDCDDIPDDIVLDNVPISPRPAHERPPTRSPSPSSSPSLDSFTKERVRNMGNGTPPIAQDQGSLRTLSWKSDSSDRSLANALKIRTNSWNAALADLSAEAKALTEKLEEHADEMEEQCVRQPSTLSRPNTWNSSRIVPTHVYDRKERGKSSTPELPPLRRINIMVDPLPVSKEKEAVLSRTRPSWLPPKDPCEEKRHLREYQQMMAASAKVDERREAARRQQIESRDRNAANLMYIWENDIIPRWNDAIRERRTSDMWWRGVAPRSRGAVWTQAIGNELSLSTATFHTALSRAQDLETRVKNDRGDAEDVRQAKWLKQIRQDASERTWRELRIFEVGGPLHQALVDVLSAYAMYRNDIGYVSGCNVSFASITPIFPCGVTWLIKKEASFIALANILNRPLPLSFYTSDQGAQASAYNIVLQTLSLKSNALYEHLTMTMDKVQPELYLSHIFISLFTDCLTIDEVARLWDVYVFEGDALLVRAAVALLLSHEMALLGSKTADEVRLAMSQLHPRKKSLSIVGEVGAEDHFMQSVRDAGKS